MPQSLDFAQAAALPLTTITAWELLFDRLRVLDNAAPSQGTLLVVGAAGGVGSILVQLARQLTGLTIIGTASGPRPRPGSPSWAPITSSTTPARWPRNSSASACRRSASSRA
ncbi:hypothetical protein WJ973_12935 [Achromobacter xylosoxidans]